MIDFEFATILPEAKAEPNMKHRRPCLSKQSAALKWSGCSDTGRVRQNNEDAFLGLQFDAREILPAGQNRRGLTGENDFTFAVCDGMGGARAGEYASQIAIEKITTLLPRAFQQSASGLNAGFADVLTELFAQIHRALVYLGSSMRNVTGWKPR